MSRVKKILPVIVVAATLLFLSAGPVFAAGAIEVFKGNRFVDLTITSALFLFVVGFIKSPT